MIGGDEVNQAEALELLRRHPDSTIPELVSTMSPKSKVAATRLRDNLSNKLHHLKRFGLAAMRVDENCREIRWYPTEE